MTHALTSLVQTGTKLWLDSIDPDLVAEARSQGATGATSNPIIVADLIKTGRFDARLQHYAENLGNAEATAWALTDELVTQAQEAFIGVWNDTGGNDGYVSFELDPLLEDPEANIPVAERVKRYVELAKRWSEGHANRMIKVPATEAGIAATAEMVAAGIPVNVTLLFTERQYHAARDAVVRGLEQRASGAAAVKAVFSIFVSRIDVLAESRYPQLSEEARGEVGILNAKRIWSQNQDFWAKRYPEGLPAVRHEIVFASTGTKKPSDPPWKYVSALAGADIQTNPPSTNLAVAKSTATFTRQLDVLPARAIMEEIDRTVDFEALEEALMEQGIEKFAAPQKALLELIESRLVAHNGASV